MCVHWALARGRSALPSNPPASPPLRWLVTDATGIASTTPRSTARVSRRATEAATTHTCWHEDSQRDFWIGVAVASVILLLQVACPRYEYITFGPDHADVLMVDRGTGEHQHMCIVDRGPNSLTLPMPIR